MTMAATIGPPDDVGHRCARCGDGLDDALARFGELGVDTAEVLEVFEGDGVPRGLHRCGRRDRRQEPFGFVRLEFAG